MSVVVRNYGKADLPAMVGIWNEVVADGAAFPQEEPLDGEAASRFFGGQTVAGVAVEDGDILGLYILHPNNVGRCGHISNASYAVASAARGRKVGEALVRRSIAAAREAGFRILQFNAVVATNEAALRLYEKLGFTRLGTIPGGFRDKSGAYLDIVPHWISVI